MLKFVNVSVLIIIPNRLYSVYFSVLYPTSIEFILYS